MIPQEFEGGVEASGKGGETRYEKGATQSEDVFFTFTTGRILYVRKRDGKT